MMLADLLLMLVIGYVLYRFIYGFVLPVMRTTRHVREQFRNMQGSSNEFGGYGQASGGEQSSGGSRQGAAGPRQGAGASGRGPGGPEWSGGAPGAAASKQGSKPPAEDYIDFEEIK